jgi:hypothetical protein
LSGFQISKEQSLPEESALWTFADLAIKGAGKTYAACVLAEEMVKHDVPIIALDGIGIWWGLRVGVNGHKGLPIVVFGGAHKDLPIPAMFGKHKNLVVDEAKLQLMVKAILEAGISAVIDTSEFSKSMQRRIVATFVNELYHLNAQYGVRHVFIEEADLWIPQRIVGDVALSAGAIDDLVRRGGNFNLGCTLISQRHAVVNKDVLTQASCLFILRTVHDLDKKAVKAWVENVARPRDPKIQKWFDGLRDLKDGEAWIWHPTEPVIFKKIKFRERHTLHATREFFRTPEAKRAEKVDVSEFIEKFKKVFEPPTPPPPKPSIMQRVVETLTPPPSVRNFEVSGNPVAPPIPQPDSISQDPISIPLTLPNLNVPQTLAMINVRLEPQTTMARLLVVLHEQTDAAGNKKWPVKSMLEALANHGWAATEDEIRSIIPTLLQTEHLTAVAAGNRTDYKFTGRARLRIIEQHPEVTIA